MAVRCAAGTVLSRSGRCAPAFRHLCLPCTDDDDCGDVDGAVCLDVGGERRCGEPCIEGACPAGYTCDASSACVPSGGSCSCHANDHFDVACALVDPMGRVCAGEARCDAGNLSSCTPPSEACNELDDDCDGRVDETYRDARGAYSLDIHNCGMCGVDCTANPVPAGALACGGDAFAPSCVLDCADTHDGIQPGDHVDADRDIATGCECTVRSSTDAAGPVGAMGEALDVNCDGADGVVVASFYVATDGDDAAVGSPTRPMKTIGAAITRAAASMTTPAARPHVFVATGTYAEVLSVPSGVQLHGGYRRDFLALDPNGFVSEVRAPSSVSVGGYALTLRGTITSQTTVEWFRLVGADAASPSSVAIGVHLPNANSLVRLHECEVRAGVPGAGADGARGASGANPAGAPSDGAVPRGAIENAMHVCIASSANTVLGGSGGSNACRGLDVGGGAGGSPHCPVFQAFAPDGAAGRGTIAGTGGHGGQDSQAPISGPACPNAPVCCGLADFSVPSNFVTPGPGDNGRNGAAGASGRGCANAYGAFVASSWTQNTATSGTPGSPGSGGGGGGGGGGVEFNFVAGSCPFVDGLGGGGGGGGAGGCGGEPGTLATSGAPSVALLLTFNMSSASGLPDLEGTRFVTNDGGRGGDGGAGGAGGVGGSGAIGAEIPRAQRTTPTLAGPFGGGRGGRGGDGGSGGSGGGGCGGPSVGVWVTGLGSSEPAIAATWRANNLFNLGQGGAVGRGGGASGSSGVAGGSSDVLFR